MDLNDFAKAAHSYAKRNGFWDDEKPNLAEKIALLHSELSEILEALRHKNPTSPHIPVFGTVEEEIADVFIRLMDLAGYLGIDVDTVVSAKMAFNETRPHRHGKSF